MSCIGVIFDPLKEQAQNNDFVGGMGIGYRSKIVYPFSVQLPENGKLLSATTLTKKDGSQPDIFAVQRFESVFFRPSANLDIDYGKWQLCLKDSMVQVRLKIGSISVIEPTKEALALDPDGIGFHMYSVDNALKLVKATNTLDLLKEWSLKEERKEIINAVDAQYDAVERHLLALKDG
jgi:hypothetical protein